MLIFSIVLLTFAYFLFVSVLGIQKAESIISALFVFVCVPLGVWYKTLSFSNVKTIIKTNALKRSNMRIGANNV